MSEKYLLGTLAVVAYGLSAFLLWDITWQELGGVGCLVLGAYSAHEGNKL